MLCFVHTTQTKIVHLDPLKKYIDPNIVFILLCVPEEFHIHQGRTPWSYSPHICVCSELVQMCISRTSNKLCRISTKAKCFESCSKKAWSDMHVLPGCYGLDQKHRFGRQRRPSDKVYGDKVMYLLRRNSHIKLPICIKLPGTSWLLNLQHHSNKICNLQTKGIYQLEW